jgi:hypothetical protein
MYSAERDKTTQWLHTEMIAGQSDVARFARPALDAAAGLSEATDAANTQLDFTSATATAAEVGLVRTISNLALDANALGRAELLRFVQEDAARLIGIKKETDAYAEFANASNSVGTTGVAMTLSDFVEGFSTLVDTNHAEGDVKFMGTSTQVKDLRDALTSSGAVVNTGLQGLMSPRRADGASFDWLGVPIYSSTLAASSGGDKIGAFIVDGSMPGGRPEFGATGRALVWDPRVMIEESAQKGAIIFRASTAYGLVEKADEFYVKAVTIA